ncbi:protein FAM135A-like isoform X2 [Watersipora subatra]
MDGMRAATVLQGVAVSRTFQVLYKNEDQLLNDSFNFTVQMLLDSHKLEESIEKAGLKFIIELWFTEDEVVTDDNMEVACSRVYDVNFSPTLGLHIHLPVIFDYFHMAAICVTVHASLIALHQPIYNPKNPAASWPLRGGHMSTLDAALFTAPVPVHAFVHIKNPRLRSANFMFKQICRLLLSAHESLQTEIKKIAKRTEHTRRPIKEPDYKDCHALLDTLCREQEALTTEEECLLVATSKIAHVCAFNVVLWQTFTEICSYNVKVIKVLAKEYHQSRVKRFSEAFFTQEWSKKSALRCFEPSVNGHHDLASVVRSSSYFLYPPSLALLCLEVDGNHTNSPIIFEDVYKDESTADAIVLTSKETDAGSETAWDATSLEDEGQAADSLGLKQRSGANKNNQMIKNSMPSMLNRPNKAYSMMEEDVIKREEKEKPSHSPELLGFKRITLDIASVEPYEIGSLSPSNERTSGLKRRKSLLMPAHERRKRKEKLGADSLDSDNATSDNFSLPADDQSSLSDSSMGSSNSLSSGKVSNKSPKSEKSFKMSNGISRAGSPSFLRRSSKKKKLAATQTDQTSHSSGNHLAVHDTKMVNSKSEPKFSGVNQLLVEPVTDNVIGFLTRKENLKTKLAYQGHLYSDFASIASDLPYFWPSSKSKKKKHLVICVHGLDGNSQDLRLVRQYLELSLPDEKFDFMMSSINEDTFQDFQIMSENLADEVLNHLDLYGLEPEKISFIAHSLGNIIVRAALTIPRLIKQIKPKLYTYLSLSGPHLGTMYSDSGLVNMAMWVMQKWKKSGSLIQLALKDHTDPKSTFIYKLSEQPGLEYFKNVLLVSSMQDKYVPYHSTRIEICRNAAKDSSHAGRCYVDMVNNLLQPLVEQPDITLVRYDAFYTLPTNTNSVIGRAGHIAVLDCELFIEKFFLVSACKYFK